MLLGRCDDAKGHSGSPCILAFLHQLASVMTLRARLALSLILIATPILMSTNNT